MRESNQAEGEGAAISKSLAKASSKRLHARLISRELPSPTVEGSPATWHATSSLLNSVAQSCTWLRSPMSSDPSKPQTDPRTSGSCPRCAISSRGGTRRPSDSPGRVSEMAYGRGCSQNCCACGQPQQHDDDRAGSTGCLRPLCLHPLVLDSSRSAQRTRSGEVVFIEARGGQYQARQRQADMVGLSGAVLPTHIARNLLDHAVAESCPDERATARSAIQSVSDIGTDSPLSMPA